ncbi:glycosyltransferase [Methylobacterium sp. JK268]
MDQPSVSIVIKALNEEGRIAMAVESALAALDGLDGEVILADSASTDRTVAIAARYPIRVVTLARAADRSCGAGGQLGYQYSRGDHVLILDGDMRLDPGFVRAALAALADDPRLAGVGGLIRERAMDNVEFEAREQRGEPDRLPGMVTRLDCGGLYRRAALESVGWFTDRNLHGSEELELGARLHAAGWTLMRIDHPGIDHYGHSDGDYRLLARRLANKTAFASGEVFRAALGRPHFRLVCRNNVIFRLCAVVHLWWAALFGVPLLTRGALAVPEMAAVLAFPFCAMALKWRSLRYGFYAVSAWNVYTLGFWLGLVRSRVPPGAWIDSRVIAEGDRPRASGPSPAPRPRSALLPGSTPIQG